MFSHCKPARLPALDDNWLKHLAGGTGDPSSPKRRNLPIAWIALKRVSPRKESMRIPSLRLGAPVQLYLLLAIELLAVGGLFASSLSGLYSVWSLQPEYSHGLLLPVLSAYLIWRQREDLKQLPFTGSWGGLALPARDLRPGARPGRPCGLPAPVDAAGDPRVRRSAAVLPLQATVPAAAAAVLPAGRVAYLASGDHALAEETLRSAIELAPNDPALKLEVAQILLQTDRAPEAVTLLEDAHYHLGVTELKLGLKDRARADLEQALSGSGLFEGSADARAALASLNAQPTAPAKPGGSRKGA